LGLQNSLCYRVPPLIGGGVFADDFAGVAELVDAPDLGSGDL
jgi:hypothetical protein